MKKTYDIAVLGGTAAGYVAAEALAKKGHSVVVLARPPAYAIAVQTESLLADWIPSEIFKIRPFLQKVKSAATDLPFRAVHFHSANLNRHAVYRSRSMLGFTLLQPRLLGTLALAARQAGVRCIRLKQGVEIDLQETSVVLNEIASPPREFRADVLLIADGRPSEVMNRLAMPQRETPAGQLTICELTVPLRSPEQKSMDKDVHIVAFAGGERFGMFFQGGGGLHVRIINLVKTGSHSAEELVGFTGKIQRAGLVPESLNLSKASAGLWRPPGGAALEMDTHTAKRTLLIGTAGGFASAMTGATLAPSILSALVAADVADRALRSDLLQETLSEFEDQWRDTLADRIRPPGTSLQMMLPMALTNKAMTARFAKAFLNGENI
ncbi:MAG: FAD-dependent oxidoreductase [Planctomycetota bacterium]|nr:FAD-dependent oxidoreductase [Planctomycetota bacterium]